MYPLESLKSSTQTLDAWADCIGGKFKLIPSTSGSWADSMWFKLYIVHTAAWKAHISHCDIGLHNLGFRIDEKGRTIGVLNDWDFAEARGDNLVGEGLRKTLIGTLAFTALNLL